MAYLEITSEVGSGDIIPLQGKEFVIGRTDDCDLPVANHLISRRHAMIVRSEDGWTLKDLDSKNGVVVNGRTTKQATLKQDDIIEMGPLRLRFHKGTLASQTSQVLDKDAVTRIIGSTDAALESRRRLRLLLEIAEALDAFDTPEKLLTKFGELSIHLFDSSHAVIRVDGDYWSHPLDEPVTEVDDAINSVVERGEAILQNDQDNRVSSNKPLTTKSVIVAPILVSDKVRGGIYVNRYGEEANPFDEEDLMLLIGVGRLISAALINTDRLANLDAENRLLRASSSSSSRLVGKSPAISELRKTIDQRVGPVRSTVLIVGETGTGKGVVAESIHLASPRKKGPFIKINCAAIPTELLESELFGHEKGSFSGASRQKKGLFEAANSGTIFLDEVSELDPSSQAKLLAVLQDHQLIRVGSAKPIDLDVRILAASNRDVQEAVSAGQFRSDLYYRLNVVRLEMSPLRERREDIPELAEHFLNRACLDIGKRIPGISKDTMTLLSRYDWPGNARELSNCLERAIIFADDGDLIDIYHLPTEIQQTARPSAAPKPNTELDERQQILDALEQSDGNKREAARLLNWYPQKFYSRLNRYGITVGRKTPDKG